MQQRIDGYSFLLPKHTSLYLILVIKEDGDTLGAFLKKKTQCALVKLNCNDDGSFQM